MAIKRNFRYQHIRTSVSGATPTADKLMDAELAVNVSKDGEKIFLKNSEDEVVSFITEAQIDAKIEEHSGSTDEKISVLSGAVDSVSGAVDYVSGVVETNTSDIENLEASKFGSVTYNSTDKKIYFYNETGGTQIGAIDTTDFVKDGMIDSVSLDTIGDTTYLVIVWNTDAGKETIRLDIGDIFEASNYYTKDETDSILSNKVDTSVYNTYTAATDAAIALKADSADVYTKSETYTKTEIDTAIETATSGKVDTSTFNTYTASTSGALDTKLDKSTFETYSGETASALDNKQDTLISGTNIKTVVNKSLLGAGNVEINVIELSDIEYDPNTGIITLDAGSF